MYWIDKHFHYTRGILERFKTFLKFPCVIASTKLEALHSTNPPHTRASIARVQTESNPPASLALQVQHCTLCADRLSTVSLTLLCLPLPAQIPASVRGSAILVHTGMQ